MARSIFFFKSDEISGESEGECVLPIENFDPFAMDLPVDKVEAWRGWFRGKRL